MALNKPSPRYELSRRINTNQSNEGRFADGEREVAKLHAAGQTQLRELNAAVDALRNDVAGEVNERKAEQLQKLAQLASKQTIDAKKAVDELERARLYGLQNPGTAPVRPLLKRFNQKVQESAAAYHDGMVDVYYQLLALSTEADPRSSDVVGTASNGDQVRLLLAEMRA